MKRIHVKRVMAFVVITLYVLGMFGEGKAAGVDVTLVVNPQSTEVSVGSGKIVITADASGENLTFTWKLSGPGKLEDEGSAAFYIPPEKIEHISASAIVTVIVQEQSGQETVKSVAFTILPKPADTASPSSESTSTEKTGMSRGTKLALGVGAVAALGGGIALAAGGGDDSGDTASPASVPTVSSALSFTGSFVAEETGTAEDGTPYTSTWSIDLQQNGAAVTGTAYLTRVFIDCCTMNITIHVTGTVNGNSAEVTGPIDTEACSCGDRTYTYSVNCNTTFTLSDDGMILTSNESGRNYYRQ